MQQGADVPLDHHVIREVKAEAEAIEWFDGADSYQAHADSSLLQGRNGLWQATPVCHLPVTSELIAMERGPFQHERQGAARELAAVDLQRFDENQRL